MPCQKHERHDHIHDQSCGHTRVEHDGHVDYLHNGHLHNVHGDHVDEHSIRVGASNPEKCTPNHDCGAHESEHVHGPNCGHEAVPHGNHIDYLVGNHLHHQHGAHCDDHGRLDLAA